MKILITGVRSSIGAVLARSLSECNQVIGWTRTPSLFQKSNMSVKKVDFMSSQGFPAEEDLTVVDAVIHLAAETPGSDPNFTPEKIERFKQVNLEGMKRLIEWAHQHQVKHFIFVSSHAVDDFTDADGIIQNPYAQSKFEAEQLLIKSGLNYTIFRPSGIYGDTPYWRSYLKEISQTSRITLMGDGSAKLQYICVDDFASAIKSSIALEKSFGKLYRIGGGDIISKRYYFEVLKEASKSSMQIYSIPFVIVNSLLLILGLFSSHYKKVRANIRASRRDLTVDNDNAAVDLNYRPRIFAEGIKTVKWNS